MAQSNIYNIICRYELIFIDEHSPLYVEDIYVRRRAIRGNKDTHTKMIWKFKRKMFNILNLYTLSDARIRSHFWAHTWNCYLYILYARMCTRPGAIICAKFHLINLIHIYASTCVCTTRAHMFERVLARCGANDFLPNTTLISLRFFVWFIATFYFPKLLSLYILNKSIYMNFVIYEIYM